MPRAADPSLTLVWLPEPTQPLVMAQARAEQSAQWRVIMVGGRAESGQAVGRWRWAVWWCSSAHGSGSSSTALGVP